MIITNKFGLPYIYEEAIRKKVFRPSYEKERDKNSFGVTRLIDSPWIYHLRDLHDDEIEMDVIDEFFAFRGSIVHQILEGVRIPNVLKELYLHYDHESGVTISGVIDIVTPDVLMDYKVKSVNSAFYFNELARLNNEQQINLYVYLFKKVWHYFPCGDLEICQIFFDWVRKKAKTDQSYPQSPFQRYAVKAWPDAVAEEYLNKRIELHCSKDKIPLCSPEERWQRPTVWALMKEGNKRATKIFASEDEIPRELKKSFYIEKRNGIDVRCIDYCNVNKFCEYFQDTYGADYESG